MRPAGCLSGFGLGFRCLPPEGFISLVLEKRKKNAYLLALSGILGWVSIHIGVFSLAALFQQPFAYDVKSFIVYPLLICLGTLLGVRYSWLDRFQVKARYQTVLFTCAHGIWATLLSAHLPSSYNGFFNLLASLIGLLLFIVVSTFGAVFFESALFLLIYIFTYMVYDIPFGIDDKLFFFFIAFITCLFSVLTHLHQKDIRKVRDLAQAQMQAQIEHDRNQQRILKVEALHRIRAAAEIAHQISNPLNYIQLALTTLTGKMKAIEQQINDLIGAGEDPDQVVVRKHFQTMFSDLREPFREAEDGVQLVAESIAEVRSISGVDGYEMENLNAVELVRLAVERMVVHIDLADYKRLNLSDLGNAPITVTGNRYISKNVLAMFLEFALRHSKDNVRVGLCWDEPSQTVTLVAQGTFRFNVTNSRELENHVKSLVRESPIELSFHWAEHELKLFYAVVDRPLVQAS